MLIKRLREDDTRLEPTLHDERSITGRLQDKGT